jgi:hypothetical protein
MTRADLRELPAKSKLVLQWAATPKLPSNLALLFGQCDDMRRGPDASTLVHLSSQNAALCSSIVNLCANWVVRLLTCSDMFSNACTSVEGVAMALALPRLQHWRKETQLQQQDTKLFVARSCMMRFSWFCCWPCIQLNMSFVHVCHASFMRGAALTLRHLELDQKWAHRKRAFKMVCNGLPRSSTHTPAKQSSRSLQLRAHSTMLPGLLHSERFAAPRLACSCWPPLAAGRARADGGIQAAAAPATLQHLRGHHRCVGS